MATPLPWRKTVLLDLFGGAIGLLLIGRAFDAQATIGVALGLALFVVTLFDVSARIVFFHTRIDMLHIEGDGLAQAGDLVLQSPHGLVEQILRASDDPGSVAFRAASELWAGCARHRNRRAGHN